MRLLTNCVFSLDLNFCYLAQTWFGLVSITHTCVIRCLFIKKYVAFFNLQRSFYDYTADYDYDYDYDYEYDTEEIFKSRRRKSKAPQDYDYDYDYEYDFEDNFCFNCAANVNLLPWIAFNRINLEPY